MFKSCRAVRIVIYTYSSYFISSSSTHGRVSIFDVYLLHTSLAALSSKHVFCSSKPRWRHLQLALLSAEELPQDVAAADQVVELLGGEVALADQTLQTLELLLGVALVGASLLEDLDVVLSVLVLEVSGDLLGLLDTITVGRLELGNNSLEGLDGATSGVETATNSAVGARVLVEVLDEGVLRAATLVQDRLGGALLEELDGRVRGNALLGGKGLCVLSLGINLGDQDVGLVDEVVGEGLPDGGEGLAVCESVSNLLLSTTKRENIRPHQGAVKATRTSWSFPTFSLNVLSSRKVTWLGSLPLTLGLMAVFSAMNLLKLSRSRPPL
jgi:hypothetical protein